FSPNHPLRRGDIVWRSQLSLGLRVPVARNHAHLKGQLLKKACLPDARQMAETVYQTASEIQLPGTGHLFIQIVSTVKFVSAVSGESHRHLLPCELGYQHGGDLGAVRK